MLARLSVHVDWSRGNATGGELVRFDHDHALVARRPPVALVADARIDNEEEIRRALGADAEAPTPDLLIRAYLAWGPQFASRLSGDYALVLWDERERRLVAARDPFGVRPLFYRAARDEVRLATGIAPLLAASPGRPLLDEGRIVEHLLRLERAANETFFRDIRQVTPGYALIARRAGVTEQRYWFPPPVETSARATVAAETAREFRRLFVQAVERRVRSPFPVVVHVSGGLDSSSIACAADSLQRGGRLPAPAVRGASALYPGLACDEGAFIDAVARHVSFPIERWDATQADPRDLVEPILDGPAGRIAQTSGTAGDLMIAQRVGARVILSGEGGDQLTTPAGIVQDMLAAHDWRAAARELFLFPGATAALRLARLRFVAERTLPPAVRRLLLRARADVPDWISPRLRGLARELAAPSLPDVELASHVQRHRWERLTSQQTMRSVAAVQRQLSGLDLEFRFPFLDSDLVRFVLSIPYPHWPAPGPYARLHREALRDDLPPEIVARPTKADFTPALRNRVLRAKNLIDDLVERGPWESEPYVDRERFKEAWDAVTRDSDQLETTRWRRVWAVATLEAWMRSVLRYDAHH